MKTNKLGTMRFEAKDENGKRCTVDVRRMPDGGLLIDLSNDPGGPVRLSREAAHEWCRDILEALQRKGDV